MVNIIVQLSKYVMILLIIMYTFLCFSIFGYQDPDRKRYLLRRQNILMFLMHAIAFAVMYLQTDDIKMLAFYLMQVVLFGATIILYTLLYPKVSRLVVNNMCMLLCIGFIMLTRLNYSYAIKQFMIAAAGIACSLVVPVIIRKFKFLAEWRKFYAVIGIFSLAAVVVWGGVSGGAKLGFSTKVANIQPSELVKIVFVFFVASSFKLSLEFKNIVITTALAAFHVLILVVSKDLGAALIIFVVYLVMLYVATRQPLYIFAGLGAGSLASVAAYYLFNHVRVRVIVWKDPLAVYANGGQQVAQSLFAIGTGSWFGLGLFEGVPNTIPVAVSDFIFAAIGEEMGLIYGLCMILICVSCYIMFLNIAMQLHNGFYKLVALGLGTCYIFQVFLAIGGVTKFIPSTGVTIPLVSYGGSSLFSTVIMFAIIQGLYILREDEEEDIERKKKERLRAKRSRQEHAPQRRTPAYDRQRPQARPQGRKAPRKAQTRPQQRVR
ncbi:FtsW/RodA/SpoVE family cell cycle protein [Dorea sp. AF24-7LB]|uniref:FtsW/RodA/SpoVE family cell cycle protein n=1 Tax=Dorea sp. AF24-7LB TaxID=2293097 RepID=UPI000E4A79F4|nr:FtsW/RodA/SpoVE family cell cycle protein [Dorea sp. AF24-7LB]RHQ57878.1 FtsW/RodA/SpoVE family cell cycle protein [Dorea sp. AF24-7LB]